MPASDVEAIETARRRNLVIQLRESGATWESIADALRDRFGEERLPNGWDRRYAYKDFHRELDKVRKEMHDSMENVREMEVRRLNRLLNSVWQRATNGDTDAIDRVLKIMKRRAKLLGLDAPDKIDMNLDQVDMSDFSDEELEQIAAGEATVQEILRERE